MREELNTTLGAGSENAGTRFLVLLRRAPGLSAMVIMALIGIAISIYLTIEHYAARSLGPLSCPGEGGIVNCAKVTSSAFSFVPGTKLPITIPGMLWFVVSGGIALYALVRLAQNAPEPARLRLAHAVWGAMGLVFVLYLVYAELVMLDNICMWCTFVHILTFLTFIVALNRLTQPPELPEAPIIAAAHSSRKSTTPHANARAARTQQAARTAPNQRAKAGAARPSRAHNPSRSRRHR